MEQSHETFLEIYRCALSGKKAGKEIEIRDEKEWRSLLRLSEMHHVTPMIYEALFGSLATVTAGTGAIKELEEKAVALTLDQARMTVELLKLYQFLEKRGLHPAIIKGAICRSLYPNREQRCSTDEDLFVPGELFGRYHKAFMEYGLVVDGEKTDIETSSEVSYYNKHIYIELHRNLFPPESEAYGELNKYFAGALGRTIKQTVYGIPVRTLGYTDHLLYLLCHCYKHFLSCGAGIRLASDILLFSLTYHEEINWEHIERCCREAGMYDFCCAVFRIGETNLIPGRLPGTLKQLWLSPAVDEGPLLEDILSGGVYGVSSWNRLHSSNITLNAVGKARRNSQWVVSGLPILKILCPPLQYMKKKYPYVGRYPVLLPMSWLQRIGEYGYDSIVRQRNGHRASEAFRIGNERMRLMQKYRILEERKGSLLAGKGSLQGKLKEVYHKSHTSVFAPVLSPVFMRICDIEFFVLNAKWFLGGARRPSEEEVRLVRENVTFFFKSFERQKMAASLCRNISWMYPGVRIIVADDSEDPLCVELENVKVIHLPFNSGIGMGLETALEEIRTPYLVRMDDDELLTLRTCVHRELKYLQKHRKIDIIGFGHTTAIRCRSPQTNFREYYRQSMDYASRPLKVPHMTKIDRNHVVLGKIANIYLARTEKIREIGYDPNIRIIDHDDFFRRAAGIAVSAAALDTVVFHRHNPYDRAYRRYRSDYSKDKMYINSTIQNNNRQKNNSNDV